MCVCASVCASVGEGGDGDGEATRLVDCHVTWRLVDSPSSAELLKIGLLHLDIQEAKGVEALRRTSGPAES